MANRNQQQGRDGSDRGGRRNAVSDSGRRSPHERTSGRSCRSSAEKVASCWPLAIIPALVVAYGLKHFHADPSGMTARGPVITGLAAAYLLNSLFTVWFYREDKRLAERQLRRIPEFHLHFWELFFGWPGALFAQRKYRHKWKKLPYMIQFWLYVLLNLALAAYLFSPEETRAAAEQGIRLLRDVLACGS